MLLKSFCSGFSGSNTFQQRFILTFTINFSCIRWVDGRPNLYLMENGEWRIDNGCLFFFCASPCRVATLRGSLSLGLDSAVLHRVWLSRRTIFQVTRNFVLPNRDFVVTTPLLMRDRHPLRIADAEEMSRRHHFQ